MHYTADLVSIPPAFRDGATLLNAPQARPIPPPPANEPVTLKVTPGAPVTVEARLNGVALTLIVDTGADRTVISPEVIERAGLAGGPGRRLPPVGRACEGMPRCSPHRAMRAAQAKARPQGVKVPPRLLEGRRSLAGGTV